ncbi:MAG: hypothetical protein JXA82_11165 [Sedimentisphaerales bacterium]|nr:hypothetical protein [Sedimentisphaerales bacterium]
MQTSLIQDEIPAQAPTTCPNCGRPILSNTECCSFCKSPAQTAKETEGKWYHATSSVVIGLLTLGPFALPMVWFHPRYNCATKVIVSIVVIGFTAALCYATYAAVMYLIDQIQELGLTSM